VYSAKRAVNRRGQGAGLREEIVEAAARLLGASASREAVTLRAIAREAGIAAPSIYPHFADRDAVLDAVVSRTFAELAQACSSAATGATSGVEEVRAICRAYAAFASNRPGQYQILFQRSPDNLSRTPQPYPEGIRAFELLSGALERMVAEGTSTSTDPTRDAQALWAALHGLATVVPATPGFPWRDATDLLDRLVEALTRTQA
jgi:AcrR family transcriptional regulator